ncbi:MAG: nucleotidyl transferase AbiEii/AbiGii toxin family protein, partial [Methylococcales bacterium]|nr:nucleotidyl transferase AbiEii/AbiGii toxin family protein [Methylococcales bacterium]
MNKRPLKDIPASIHQRLLNIAKETQRPFNEVLQYYAMERLLDRLSRSRHTESFVLKGALLFRVWNVPDGRATRDIDLLAYTENSPENLAAIFCELCKIIDANDGVIFDPDTLNVQTIK